MRSTKIMNRLNGYDRHFKGRFLSLHRKLLSDSEYVLWDLSFSVLAEWDKKNHDPEEYGSFVFTQADIGYLLGWSKTKVSNKAKKLVSSGLWVEKDGRLFVSGFGIRDEFSQIAKERKVIDLQEYVSNLKPTVSKQNTQVPNMKQQVSKGNGVIPLKTVSVLKQLNSKAPLVSFKSEFNVCKSESDYQRIWKEMGCPLDFTVDDMRWIDTNIREDQRL